MAAHALQLPPAAPHLKLVVSRPAAVWPAPPPLAVHEPAMSPTMKRCLLLALLLHVWLVLMLGNAPGGTAAPGQGVAGSLNITLQGPETPGATEQTAPPLPAPAEGATGSATLPRWGGVVREQAVAAPPTPGAAQLGRWAATPQPADTPELPPPPPGRVVEDSAQARPAPAGLEAPSPAPSPAPALAPAEVAAPPLPRLSAAPPAPATATALPALAPESGATALPALATPVAAPAALPVPQALTPRLQRGLPPVAADFAPLAPALPVTAPLPALQAPAALPLPAPLPAVPAAMAPAAEAPAPMAPAPSLPADMAPAANAPAPTPLVASTPAATSPAPSTPAAPPLAAATAPAARPTPTPSLPPAAFSPGAPDAGSRLGVDVATPAAAAASAPPRLNLQLSRPRGGELSRGRGAGMLPVLPRPPEVDEKLGRDIAKSAKQDCKDAYRGAGLLAVVPLAAQALKADSSCKW